MANNQIASSLIIQRQMLEISWQPLNPPWYKLNTDESLKYMSNMAGASRIIQNALGGWIGGFIVNLGSWSVFDAKYWGIIFSLNLAWDMGIT